VTRPDGLVPVEGWLERVDGNRMPGPDPAPAATTAGPGRQVLAIGGTLSAAAQPLWTAPLPADRLLGQASTDGQGRFRLLLPPGPATLLIAVPGGYWLNRFDGRGDFASLQVQPGLAPVRLVDDRGAVC